MISKLIGNVQTRLGEALQRSCSPCVYASGVQNSGFYQGRGFWPASRSRRQATALERLENDEEESCSCQMMQRFRKLSPKRSIA